VGEDDAGAAGKIEAIDSPQRRRDAEAANLDSREFVLIIRISSFPFDLSVSAPLRWI
jgi:hypothetical protein